MDVFSVHHWSCKRMATIKTKIILEKMPYTMCCRFRKRIESYSVYGCSTLMGLAKDASGFQRFKAFFRYIFIINKLPFK